MIEPFEFVPEAIEGYKFAMKLPVQYGDVDAMGHVNNVTYLGFVETVRLEYMIRLMELPQNPKLATKLPFVMGGQNINYRSPAFYREVLLIGVRAAWVRRSSFGLDFAMRDLASGRLVADGSVTHVMYNHETSRSMPLPDEWLARLEAFEGRKLRE